MKLAVQTGYQPLIWATENRVLERQLTRRGMKELLRESEEGMLLKS